MVAYRFLMGGETQQKVVAYQQALARGEVEPGRYFGEGLGVRDVAGMGWEAFLETLVCTKRPQIFAESAVWGNGRDWSQAELSILGDLSVAVPVRVYDNGEHAHPVVHKQPIGGTLCYVPGALLQNGCGIEPADWAEVTEGGEIDVQGYYRLNERRLLPVLRHADRAAGARGREAMITMPGLGCGQFAGPFRGRLGSVLLAVLVRLLEEHGAGLSNIRAVYYDPYRECENERLEIGGISLQVRPLAQGNAGKGQLCRPQAYEQSGDDFSGCDLFSLVAWDHVSWPGNDFYRGARVTDDGVKAAATDSMAVITGVSGGYSPQTYTYDPPAPFRDWAAVVEARGVQLKVQGNCDVCGIDDF